MLFVTFISEEVPNDDDVSVETLFNNIIFTSLLESCDLIG